MNKQLITKLCKSAIVFICYFFYVTIFSFLFKIFGISNEIVITFIADVCFLIGIVFAYKSKLIESFNDLKHNYKLIDIIKIVLLWLLIISVTYILLLKIITIFYPHFTTKAINQSLLDISQTNKAYYIFKTMIFAIIAEQLVYVVSIRDIISNKIVFVILSSIIYTILNYLYIDITIPYIIPSILIFFVLAVIFASAYVKNKDNIILLMLIKFICQLLPLIAFMIN